MKKILSMLLVFVMLLGLLAGCNTNDQPGTTAEPSGTTEPEVSVSGNTVILYTANVRGDVDVYAKVAAAKAAYEAEGATVYLVDAGNYMQGKAAVNTDRGLTAFELMDAAGYDVAGMGLYEFVYGDATTGYMYHGNVTKYHTQAQLYKGVEETEYQKNAPWAESPVMDKLAAKEAATFKVICSNLAVGSENSGYYAFEANAVLGDTLKVGFICNAPGDLEDYVQDGFLTGYTAQDTVKPECDVTVCLGSGEGDIVIEAVDGGDMTVGAYLINNETKKITNLEVDITAADADVAALAETAKTDAAKVVGTSSVTLSGKDSVAWNGEVNLGDLTADALKWYAENKFDGFKKDVPVVAIQNGGNCDNFIYTGDITETDLLKALPFSPMGVGIIYVTGSELLETLEASTQTENCPGWAQVAGIEYTVDTTAAYDAAEAYGETGWYKHTEAKRVTITSVDGAAFDPNATYAVIADNFLMNGNDTYYTFAAIKEADATKYLKNTGDVKVRDIVAMYISEVLSGNIGDTYDAAQGRITVK